MAEAIRGSSSASSRTNERNGEQLGEDMYQAVKRNHDKVYADVRMALSMDEKGFTTKAIEFYQRALKAIARSLEIQCSGPNCVGDKWEMARKIQQKMRKTALQIKSRLEALEKDFSSQQQSVTCDPVSSNQNTPSPSVSASISNTRKQQNERTSTTNGRNSVSNRSAQNSNTSSGAASCSRSGWSLEEREQIDMNLRLEEEIASLEPPSYQQAVEDAYEVFNISEGVQIYFISSKGHVSTPSSPSSLKIYKFFDHRRGRESGQPPAFLQVGDWLYPLLPGRSPALRSADGVYLFPDYESTDQGACVGLIMPPDLNNSKLIEFQTVINDLTALQTQSVLRDPDAQLPQYEEGMEVEGQSEQQEVGVSTKIAKGIEVGASWLSWGLVRGAEIGVQLISKGSIKLKDNISPAEDPKEFDEKYQTGLVYARKATGAAVTVSKAVVDGLCYMTTKIGKEVAPILREQTDKLIKKGGDDPDGKWGKRINGTVEVVGSGLVGFGMVYHGLEKGAVALAKGIHGATVDVVQHRYGDSAAKLTDNSMATVGNVGVSVYNFKHLGVKAIAKRTAKDTGKALVDDYSEKPYEKEVTDLEKKK